MEETPKPKPHRLHVAAAIPPMLIGAIADFQNGLKSKMGHAKCIYPEVMQMHLTLQFLGNVEADQFDALDEKLAASIQGKKKIIAAFQAWELLPSPQEPREFALKIGKGQQDLLKLHEAILGSVGAWVTMSGRKPFQDHIAIARSSVGHGNLPYDFGGIEPGLPKGLSSDFKIDAIHLYSSKLTPKGPQAKIQKTYQLS